MEEQKRIIEVNGIKLEVDLRTATVINHFKVGDPVKILSAEYQDKKIYPGVIIGFGEFKTTGAIEIMMLKNDYNGADIQFITITEDTEKYEIIPWNSYEKLFTSDNIYNQFDRQIAKKEMELEDLRRKKEVYIKDFQTAFNVGVPGTAAQ